MSNTSPSQIVEELNERFGDNLDEEDRLVIDQYEGAFKANENVVAAALANDNMDDFVKVVFDPVFLDTIITQMNANEKIFKLILADDRMRVLFRNYIAQKVYDDIRSGE